MKPIAQFLPFVMIVLSMTVVNCELAGQKLELVLPVGHTTDITHAEFSPDGRFIVTIAENDITARIWETASGKLFHTLEHEKGIKSAHFSGDGKTVLTASDDQTVRLWDNSGKLLQRMEGHKGSVKDAIFTRDGKRAYSISSDTRVIIWDLQTGSLLNTFDNRDSINYCALDTSEKYLIAGSSKEIKVWDSQTGNLQRSIVPESRIDGLVVSADGTRIATWSEVNKGGSVWNLQSGAIVFPIKSKWGINRIEFTNDCAQLLISGKDLSAAQVGLYNANDGKLIKDIGSFYGGGWKKRSAKLSTNNRYVVISPDPLIIFDMTSRAIVSSMDLYPGFYEDSHLLQFDATNNYLLVGNGPSATVISLKEWKTISSLIGSTAIVNEVATKGSILATASAKGARLWDRVTGENLGYFKGRTFSLDFSPKESSIITTDTYSNVSIWNYSTRKILSKITASAAEHVIYAPDGSSFMSYGSYSSKSENKVRVYNSDGFKNIYSIALGAWENHVQYSLDGKYIVSLRGYLGDKSLLEVHDSRTGSPVSDVMFSEAVDYMRVGQNHLIASCQNRDRFSVKSKTLTITDMKTGEVKCKILGKRNFYDAAFVPGGRQIATAAGDSTATLWDITSGKEVVKLHHPAGVTGVWFDPGGNTLLTAAIDDSVRKWSVSDKRKILSFKKKGAVKHLDWENNLLYTHNNSELSVYNIKTGNYLFSLLAIDSADWIVTHVSGLFDASQGAMDKLYFVQGLDVVDFSQLKERYYEPGLWKKMMSGERLRDVSKFTSIDLPPNLANTEVTLGNTTLSVTNREGGIGQITVLVNGLEVIEDVRPKGFNPKSKFWSTELKLTTLPNLKKGEENLVEVRAWNEGHWVISRPLEIRFTPPATRGVDVEVAEVKKTRHPSIFILTVGVSDYYGDKIDLKYAAKDAEAMSTSLGLGARRLFGTDSTFGYSLTDNSERKPTKENIKLTFAEIAKKSSAHDVFVVYLSGHGINCCGEEGDFYYLTNEAYSTSLEAYKDTGIRGNTTLSSKELVDLFKTVPSDKRVLIIDACASGKMVQNLMASRDIESSTLKALDRMRDRTGFHIITGCAADAVSYEASRFGQGVLTYSLIEGIKGASLKDQKSVDVNLLFQYARERVPVLAKGIGGIQSPQIFSPTGAQSFDIGILDDETKSKIPLPKTRPVYVRSIFVSGDTFSDSEKLSGLLNESLNDLSSKGEKAPLLFMDIEEFDDACHLSGMYKRSGDLFTLTYRIQCGKVDNVKTISANGKEKLIELLMGDISK